MEEQVADWLDSRLTSDPMWVAGDPQDAIDAADDVLVANESAAPTGGAAVGAPDSPSWLDDASLVGVDVVDGADAIVVSERAVADAMATLPDQSDTVLPSDLLTAPDPPIDHVASTVDPFDVMLASDPEHDDVASDDAGENAEPVDTDDGVALARQVVIQPPAGAVVEPDAEVSDSVASSIEPSSPVTQFAGSGLDAFDDLDPASAGVSLDEPDEVGPGLDPAIDPAFEDDVDGFDGGFA